MMMMMIKVTNIYLHIIKHKHKRPKCVKGEQAADVQVTTLSSACLSNPKRADCIKWNNVNQEQKGKG